MVLSDSQHGPATSSQSALAQMADLARFLRAASGLEPSLPGLTIFDNGRSSQSSSQSSLLALPSSGSSTAQLVGELEGSLQQRVLCTTDTAAAAGKQVAQLQLPAPFATAAEAPAVSEPPPAHEKELVETPSALTHAQQVAAVENSLREASMAKTVAKRPAAAATALSSPQTPCKRPAAVTAAAALKRPAAAADRSRENFCFEAKVWGRCKVEFYGAKSYIRQWDEASGKLRLVIGCERSNHHDVVSGLVKHVKAGKGLEALKTARAKLQGDC